MANTIQLRIRIPREQYDLYESTLKEVHIDMKDDITRYISDVIRTKGVKPRELLGKDLRAKSDSILAQVKIDLINMQEYHTNALNLDVAKALARTSKDGSIRVATYESIEHYMKKIADTNKVPSLTVLNCMRQQIYTLYQDNTGELNRIIKILEQLQDVELKAVV